MSAIRADNTGIEKEVRRIIFRRGIRFSLNKGSLPGKPDIYIKKHNAVIFVNGCFWHQHKNCRLAVMPKSNSRFWKQKLEKNSARDKINIKRLKIMGYGVLTIWECEILAGKYDATVNKRIENKIFSFLNKKHGTSKK